MSDVWAAVLRRVSRQVGAKSFRDWFEPTRLAAVNADGVVLQVPSVLFQQWMERNFRPVIEEALHEVADERGGGPCRVEFRVAGADAALPQLSPAPMDVPGPLAAGHSREPAPGASLNPRYTFEDFIVGSCNQFAHAAARAVADAPGRCYNPLYLYGGVGLGKTHLMHAIGLALSSAHPRLRIAYVSAERFTCEMVNAIRWKRTPEFRERFRNVDVLLVDDVQFLEGKEATQEEFFHTFRTLYEEGKQVVLSSDCPPREMATLEERLRSRFESGLIADMQVPDLETKVAILRRKAEAEGAQLSEEVHMFLASRVRSNVRELEGCLTRLLALSSIRGLPPDLDLAREAVRDLFPEETRPVTVEAIQRFVADHYRVKISDLKARNNARVVAFPRQVAMYLCKKMTTHSFPDIGKRFGGKHHSTVIHSVNKITDRAAKEEDFHRLLDRFMHEIH